MFHLLICTHGDNTMLTVYHLEKFTLLKEETFDILNGEYQSMLEKLYRWYFAHLRVDRCAGEDWRLTKSGKDSRTTSTDSVYWQQLFGMSSGYHVNVVFSLIDNALTSHFPWRQREASIRKSDRNTEKSFCYEIKRHLVFRHIGVERYAL